MPAGGALTPGQDRDLIYEIWGRSDHAVPSDPMNQCFSPSLGRTLHVTVVCARGGSEADETAWADGRSVSVGGRSIAVNQMRSGGVNSCAEHVVFPPPSGTT